ncbi:MAG TPA: hypothetical protein VKA65_11665 [Acidimicrobiales bacterium]|nr:hypothetical protein [Acidimicrobiales bacterium]
MGRPGTLTRADAGGPEPTGSPDDGKDAAPTGGGDEAAERAASLDGLTWAERSRLRRAWALTTLGVLVLYAWVLTAGRWDFLQRRYFDDFFDVQARALFHGRLDVPPEVVGFEGFLIGGKTYIYFGPVPALLRMPVLLVTDRLDGRLTTISMLVALTVLSWGAFRLTCALRPLVRDRAPLGKREPLAAAALAAALLTGPPFFLAAEAVVYHEATLWGLALTAIALDAVVRWAQRPTGWRLAGAVTWTSVALLTRQSLGLAPLTALGLVCLVFLWRDARAKDGPWWRRFDRQAVVVLGVALAVPLVLTVFVNYAKFRTTLTPPSSAHVQSILFAERREMLEENGGSLFGVQFLPSTTWQYVRPDGIDVRRDFPWIDFPRFGPSQVTDASFDNLDWTSSIPASAPALTVLAVVAVVAAVRSWRRRRRGTATGPPWQPWVMALGLGTVAGGLGVLGLGYIANRYLNDLVPAVFVPAVVGFHVAVASALRWGRPLRALAVAATALLLLVGLTINLALALSYQRERGPVVPEEWRAEWVGWRVNLPGAWSPYLVDETWRAMPRDRDVFDGRLAIIGQCSGLYLHRNDDWIGVERGPDVGVYDIVVDLDDLPEDGSRVPLLTLGRRETSIVGIVRVDEDRVRVDVAAPPNAGGLWRRGPPVELSGEVTIRVDADPRQAPFAVTHERTALNWAPFANDEAKDLLGAAPPGRGVAMRFPGRLRVETPDMSVCWDALDTVRYDRRGDPIVDG